MSVAEMSEMMSEMRWPQAAARMILWLLVVLLGFGLSGCTTPSTTTPSTTTPSTTTPSDGATSPAGDVIGDARVPTPSPITQLARGPHSEWAEAVLYFVVLDRFADGDPSNNVEVDPRRKGHFHGGDLAGLRSRLDDLAELGVTVLWITPVVKNIDGPVHGAGFPDYGYHGYWADDFERLDPRFGTEAELKSLVDAAHERGIAILLDVVYNHVGYESSYTKSPRWRPFLRSSKPGGCGTDDLTLCLAGLPDWETDRREVRDYLMGAHLGLAERVGLDGFRLDTVKHVEHDFWQEHRRAADERLGEDFFLLGEVWGGDAKVLDPWFENDEIDAGFDFAFQGSTLAFVQGRGRPVAYGRYLEKRDEIREGCLLSHYLGSHDTPTALHTLDGDIAQFRLAVFLQMTVWGIPQVYYGEEVGRVGGDWPENRSDMPWGDLGIAPGDGLPRDEALRDYYRFLIDARRSHPALWRGSHHAVGHGEHWLSFYRNDSTTGDQALVLVNRAEAEAAVALDPSAEADLPADLPTSWRDVRTDDIFEIREGRLEVPMPAQSGRILVPTVP